ncbi:poly(U)-specific endoribonuclease-like isoform X1 [Monodelphis domestica]|uniref:poly(U)-specific endoribonuclease-like isoform X1 n=1 Tax=Monodelphis domestica TaxID=13616 RepID=UPI00020F73F4|nr:poly(U)-specific endoribonuclease-like isoform X1 [Monodelphis domestica]
MASGLVLNHELSKLFNQLWDADLNRLGPGRDYAISLQGKADFVPQGIHKAPDHASQALFLWVNEGRLQSTKTFAAFISLLDNYETSTGVAENVTLEEEAENNRFLDAILETEVMKLAHQYLVRKNLSKPSQRDFKAQLYSIWFQLYTRDGRQGPDSCGFEHVFVGETRRGQEILGFHNWVQFYLQEKRGNIDYKGYVARQHKSRPDEDDQVLNLQFSWKGLVKPVGSTFLGVSPEFEFALFTIVFLQSQEKVTRVLVGIEEYELQIVVYRHGHHIGSAYPKLVSSNNEALY